MDDDLRDKLQSVWGEYERSKRDPVRIGLLGQPGAGKSSLINSIVGQPVASVGVETDYTTGPASHAWNEIVLVDLPGYGTEGFPKEGFLDRFGVFEFDALLCVSNTKFRSDDLEFFREVVARGKESAFVRTHASSLKQPGKTKDELKRAVRDDLAQRIGQAKLVLEFVDNDTQEGIPELQDAIVNLLTPARRAKFFRWAHGTSDTFLTKKRESCNELIRWYTAGAALNGFNPVPGGDVAVDLGIVVKMFYDVLSVFGFTKNMLSDYLDRFDFLSPIITPVLTLLTRGGAAMLAGFAGGALAKWIPLLGPIIAGSTSAVIVFGAGHNFADRCHEIAIGVRDAELLSRADAA